MKTFAFRVAAPAVVALLILFGAAKKIHAQQDEYGRGAILPDPNQLHARVAAQNTIAIRTNTMLGAVVGNQQPTPTALSACNVNARHFNWNDQKVITQVENQHSCGSCWAFATVAAYEASYLIQSNQTTDVNNLPVNDLSEQEVLDCTTPASPSVNSCKGGWHDDALKFIAGTGETDLGSYGSGKYENQKAAQCKVKTGAKMSYVIANWGYVGDGIIPTNDQIKGALCEHGPVVTAVNSAGWNSYAKTDPSWAQSQDHVFVGLPSPSKALTWANIQKADIDHEVLIVGWDEDLDAWIIKNSWNTDWGLDGFMLLKRNTANVGFNAAWVSAETEQFTPAIANKVAQKFKLLQQQKVELVKQELRILQ
jgi:cathepsin L